MRGDQMSARMTCQEKAAFHHRGRLRDSGGISRVMSAMRTAGQSV